MTANRHLGNDDEIHIEVVVVSFILLQKKNICQNWNTSLNQIKTNQVPFILCAVAGGAAVGVTLDLYMGLSSIGPLGPIMVSITRLQGLFSCNPRTIWKNKQQSAAIVSRRSRTLQLCFASSDSLLHYPQSRCLQLPRVCIINYKHPSDQDLGLFGLAHCSSRQGEDTKLIACLLDEIICV